MSKSTRAEFIKALKTGIILPLWARSVYGNGTIIVASDGVPGGESRWSTLKEDASFSWDWRDTYCPIVNGAIDMNFETPVPQKRHVHISITGPGNSGKTVIQNIITNALRAHGIEVDLDPATVHENQLAPFDFDANAAEYIPMVKERTLVVVSERHTRRGLLRPGAKHGK